MRRLALLGAVLAGLAGLAPEAQAQTPLPAAPAPEGESPAPTLPETLTPALIDATMARLSDAEVRALLRDELGRQAAEQAAQRAAAADPFTALAARIRAMQAEIADRAERWAVFLGDIGARAPRIAERLALAEHGTLGMALAMLVLVAAGLAAAGLVARLTAPWRRWLRSGAALKYWERVLYSGLLFGLEFVPIVAFVAVTRAVAALMPGALGPFNDYVWIYHAGVSHGWAGIVAARRLLAPEAPALRIARLGDGAAGGLYALVSKVVVIGVAGWLIAGLSPTLGLGFPPAIITVALAGTAVLGLLLAALVRRRAAIRDTLADLLPEATRARKTGEVIAAAAPALAGLYLMLAYLYWVGHWLEAGRHELAGPAGTLAVLLLLPAFDRLGLGFVLALLRGETERAERCRQVLHRAWRLLIGLIATGVVFELWGLSLYDLAKGRGAPVWASALFDIVITLLIARVIWQLIIAVLERPERATGDAEDPEAMPAASRLETLVPLLRNLLLAVLAMIVVMIALSAIGVDIGPLLASAGIVGIAIGFGAQTLVRDIFSGVFFLIDDAFRVGEYIELDQDLRGEVEAISIRSLKLRHHRGPVITIPFGELKSVTNHNRDWVIYKMNFRLEPETDPHKVKKLVKGVGQELMEHPEHGPKFLQPLKSQGVFMIDDDSALVIRVKFMCKPRAQFVLRREVYHRLREVFAENGIHLARRKVEVVSGPGHAGEEAGAAAGALPAEVVDPPAPGAA